jgi:glycosyltransferase involved in cell wall biosynthesis
VFDHQSLRVGFVGRMVPIKRPDLFVAAAHHLSHEMPERFSFYMFGDGPLAQECEEFVERHHLSGEVHLLGFSAHMPAWLAHLDVLVLCSDHEGLPMVLLEALALGVPVVAHAVGGMPHVLGCGEYGVLVREQTPDGYVDALRTLADQPEATASRAQRARAYAQSRYAIAHVAERYVRFYRTLLAAPAGQRRIVYD